MKRAFRKNMAIADIKIGNDRRPIHYEAVKGIAESFKVIGQLHPITVDEDDVLRAGLHRLEAAKLCEWSTIEATIIESGPEADLAEADENLQRHGLDTLQFSRAVAARKRAWEEINGKIKAGRKPKAVNSDTVSELNPPKESFVEETAAMHGVSTRTVERGVAIGEGLTEEAVAVLADSPLADSPKALAAIAAEPKSKQVAAARRAVKERAAPKKPKEDREPKNGAVVGWTPDRDAEITSMMGKLVRLVDERAKHTGSKAGHTKCLNAMRAFGEEWKSWRTGKT